VNHVEPAQTQPAELFSLRDTRAWIVLREIRRRALCVAAVLLFFRVCVLRTEESLLPTALHKGRLCLFDMVGKQRGRDGRPWDNFNSLDEALQPVFCFYSILCQRICTVF